MIERWKSLSCCLHAVKKIYFWVSIPLNAAWFFCGSSGSTSKPSVRCSLLGILDIKTTCLISQSQTSLQIWTATRCSASFGGWTIASVRVLALELLEIHSLEEKLWTFASTPGARWLTLVTPSAPTCVFACASLISAPCLQHLDPQFVFASTKSLLVVMDGAASSCLIGLLALVIPSGSTTSSASVSASLPHKPMDVLSLLSRSRSCASRVEPNWPPQWKVVSCVPQWALVCASGTNVLCHQLRELPCFPASIYWTPRAPRPNHSHMDPESSEVAVMSAFKCWALQDCEPSQPSSTCLIPANGKESKLFCMAAVCDRTLTKIEGLKKCALPSAFFSVFRTGFGWACCGCSDVRTGFVFWCETIWLYDIVIVKYRLYY